jgi:predicted MFS family arabinose efflux permease
MGSVMSLMTLAHSLGMLAGALLAGLAMDWFDLSWAFPVGAVIMLGGIAAFRCGHTDTPTPASEAAPLD